MLADRLEWQLSTNPVVSVASAFDPFLPITRRRLAASLYDRGSDGIARRVDRRDGQDGVDVSRNPFRWRRPCKSGGRFVVPLEPENVNDALPRGQALTTFPNGYRLRERSNTALHSLDRLCQALDRYRLDHPVKRWRFNH